MRSEGKLINATSSLYKPFSHPLVVARVPVLPLRIATAISEATDLEGILESILTEFPIIYQAIAVASPTLLDALAYRKTEKEIEKRVVPLRVLAYILRMATRTTPFGLFTSVGRVATSQAPTTLSLGSMQLRTSSRIDMEFLSTAIRTLEADPISRRKFRYQTNNYVTIRDDRLIVQGVDLTILDETGNQREVQFEPITIKHTELVEAVRSKAHDPINYAALADYITNLTDAPKEKTEEFLDRLITAGLLISSIRVNPTSSPVDNTISAIRNLETKIYAQLVDLRDQLRHLDSQPVESRTSSSYRDIQKAFVDAKSSDSAIFQLDASHEFSGQLDAAILMRAAELAEIWTRSNCVIGIPTYREKFIARYNGTERRVPLLAMVDPDLGIGPPPEQVSIEEHLSIELQERRLAIALRAVRDGVIEIELTKAEIEHLLAPIADTEILLESFDFGFEIMADNVRDIDDGKYLVCPSIFIRSPAATQSMGRFAGMLGKDMVDAIKSIQDDIRDTEFLNAELVYPPAHSRMSNVCIRPMVQPYAINFGTHSAISKDRTLDLDDLYVGLEDGRFRVWSRSHDKEVRIHEGHVMHGRNNVPDAIRFLSLTTLDGTKSAAGFNWGEMADRLPMLPRLRFGSLILSIARWILPADVFRVPRSELFEVVSRERAMHGIPEQIYVIEIDHRIPVNLTTNLGLDLFADLLRKKPDKIAFHEVFPSETNAWLKHENGDGYRVEFIASLRGPKRQRSSPPFFASTLDQSPERIKGLGSEWLSLKIYCGLKRIDEVLLKYVMPFVDALTRRGQIRSWYFVRYADPDGHIRIRLRTHSVTARCAALASAIDLGERLLQAGTIESYVFDTYTREYERYGGTENYELVEESFSLSSQAVVACLPEISDENTRVAQCLRTFFYTYLHSQSDSVLADIANYHKGKRRTLLQDERELIRTLRSLFIAIRRRTNIDERDGPSSTLLDAIGSHDVGRRPLSEIVSSLLHMHCNRFGIRSGPDERIVTDIFSAALIGALAAVRT